MMCVKYFQSKHFGKLAALALVVLIVSSCSIPPAVMEQMKDYVGDAASGTNCVPLETMFNLQEQEKLTLIHPETGSETGVVTWVLASMNHYLDKAAEEGFRTIGEDFGFRRMLTAMMTMAILFYTISLVLGIVPAKPYGVVLTYAKLALVWSFSTNWAYFHDYIREMVEGFILGAVEVYSNAFALGALGASERPVADTGDSGNVFVVAGPFGDGAFSGEPFSVVDNLISVVFSTQFIQLALGMLTNGFAGVIHTLALTAVIMGYFTSVVMALHAVMIAMIARALLYAIAPLFIMFAMFQGTKSFFDGWVKQLIAFILQPIFVFIIIGFYHSLFVGFLNFSISNYETCVRYSEVGEVAGSKMYFWSIGDGTANSPSLDGSNAPSPLHLFGLFSLIALLGIMGTMINWSLRVANKISGGFISAINVPLVDQGMKQQAQEGLANLTNSQRGGLSGVPTASAGRTAAGNSGS